MRPAHGEEPQAEMAAVIYCRVSSAKQKTEGGGLESQEHRCRKYADERGYSVVAVFPDDSSGGGDFMKRPGMVALLAFLDAQRGEPPHRDLRRPEALRPRHRVPHQAAPRADYARGTGGVPELQV